MIGDGGKNLVQKAAIPGAIIMPQEQHYFLQEMAFTQSQAYIFGSLEVKHFWIDPTAYTPDAQQTLGRIISEVPTFFAEAGPLIVKFYNAAVLGAAVATPLVIPSFNRVSTSARTPQMVLNSLNVAPDTVSGLFSEIVVPSSSQGGQKVGFSVSEALPFDLDLTKQLYISVTNKNGADTDVGIRWNWFEI